MKTEQSKLVTLTKRLTHRELSPKQLEKTREGVKETSNFFSSRTDKIYSTVDGRPQLEISVSSIKTTPDLSHPDIKHTMHYNDRTTFYTYNTDGKLTERYIQFGSICTGDMDLSAHKFDPPGCWRGKEGDGPITQPKKGVIKISWKHPIKSG